MMDLKRKRLEGFCRVTDDTGASWHLPRSEFAKVRMAWLKGAQFVDTFGFHGDALTIRLANVDSIGDLSADAVNALRAEDQADAADDLAEGVS